MSSLQKGSSLRLANYGPKVEKAAATLPQTGNQDLFVVSGGRIIVTGLVGVVTTAVQAQANAAKLVVAPTVGAAQDLSATAELNGAALGTLIGFTGTPGGASSLVLGSGAVTKGTTFVVNPGVIRLNTAASSTGATRWTLLYIPLDDAAQVVSA